MNPSRRQCLCFGLQVTNSMLPVFESLDCNSRVLTEAMVTLKGLSNPNLFGWPNVEQNSYFQCHIHIQIPKSAAVIVT